VWRRHTPIPSSRATTPDRATISTVSLGVYVHIPFCARACDYCDFAKWTDRGHLTGAYVAACRRDVDRRVAAGELRPATSVFFGGGTPSLLEGHDLVAILDGIPRVPGAEVTVECNPDTVDAEKLATYRAAGVTRLSFGVQSMRPEVLVSLGRTHDPASVLRAVRWAREAGFDTFNLDLIYGAPGESANAWRATIDAVLALEPPHVSAYALTVEPATPLGRRIAAGAPAPDDDDQATKYEMADDRLVAAGLDWYEVSNWARPGHECRHNLLTWAGGDYVPIGCAAHGHREGRRWWNVRTPERFIERVEAGDDPEAGHEELGPRARADESLTLALRTCAGAAVPHAARDEASALEADGLVELRSGRAVLTRRGRLLATEVTARLLLAAPASSDVPVGDPALAASDVGTRYD
jgi:putative oxygen-independent coproporphyrinogen III oxidase